MSFFCRFPWIFLKLSLILAVVLTAGHCTYQFRSFELGFGSHIFNAPLIRQNVVARIQHPNYNPDNLNNDIALIPLQTPLTFGLHIQPINLPTLSQEESIFLNHRMVVSGFGKTSDTSNVSKFLNWVNLRIILNDDCASIFGRKVVVPSIICARGWDTSNQNVCQGDSGGPGAWNNHGEWIQLGIVSFVSSKGCAHGHPSGFTRVTSYLRWISQNSGVALRNWFVVFTSQSVRYRNYWAITRVLHHDKDEWNNFVEVFVYQVFSVASDFYCYF